MKQYETGFLLSPQLTEEEAEAVVQQMAEVIAHRQGTIVKVDKWGKRRTAYPLGKFHDAYYYFFHYEGGPDIPAELARRFRQLDTVLRYLTLTKETQQNMRRKKKPHAKPKPVEGGEAAAAEAPAETKKEEA
ncbi:MAG: 30S ribosomal protein S6 [Acidobacteriota bacterium]|nr:30S ribosomal protein S6 [Acidobacteriota bacterium]